RPERVPTGIRAPLSEIGPGLGLPEAAPGAPSRPAITGADNNRNGSDRTTSSPPGRTLRRFSTHQTLESGSSVRTWYPSDPNCQPGPPLRFARWESAHHGLDLSA